jgi:hypothetical protein
MCSKLFEKKKLSFFFEPIRFALSKMENKYNLSKEANTKYNTLIHSHMFALNKFKRYIATITVNLMVNALHNLQIISITQILKKNPDSFYK